MWWGIACVTDPTIGRTEHVVVIAHLSDTHLDGSRHRFDRVKAVMDYLNALPYDLDAVLVTGDVADHGLTEEYEQARDVLTSRHPLLACPGNHDARSPFREVLLKEPAGDAPVNQAYRTASAMFALCDSSIPGQDDGRLSDETQPGSPHSSRSPHPRFQSSSPSITRRCRCKRDQSTRSASQAKIVLPS